MADRLRTLALQAQASIAALLAEAEVQNKLWPDDVSKLSGALSVATQLSKERKW